MPSSFGQYTGGIAPVQGISEAGARIGQMAQQGYQDFGKSLAGGIQAYNDNSAKNDVLTSEAEALGSQIQQYAQMFGDSPEHKAFADSLQPYIEQLAKVPSQSLTQKMGTVTSVKAGFANIGQQLQVFEMMRKERLQRTMAEAGYLVPKESMVYNPSALKAGTVAFDPNKSPTQNIADFDALIKKAQSDGHEINADDARQKYLANIKQSIDSDQKIDPRLKATLKDQLEAYNQYNDNSMTEDNVFGEEKLSVNDQYGVTDYAKESELYNKVSTSALDKMKQGDASKEPSVSQKVLDAYAPYQKQYEKDIASILEEQKKIQQEVKDEQLLAPFKKPESIAERTIGGMLEFGLKQYKDKITNAIDIDENGKPKLNPFKLGLSVLDDASLVFPLTTQEKIARTMTEKGLSPVEQIEKDKQDALKLGKVLTPQQRLAETEIRLQSTKEMLSKMNEITSSVSPVLGEQTKPEQPVVAPITNQQDIIVGSKADVRPTTFDEKKQAMQDYFMSKYKDASGKSYLPAGFDEAFKASNPEANFQTMETKYGSFVWNGKEWNQIKTATPLTNKQQREQMRGVFGTQTENGFVPLQVGEGTGVKLHGVFTGSDGELGKYKDNISAMSSARSAIAELRSIVGQFGHSLNPTLIGRAKIAMATLRAATRIEVIGVGTVSEMEQKMLNDANPDTTKTFNLDSVDIAKLDSLSHKIDNKMKMESTMNGVTVILQPPTFGKEGRQAIEEGLRQRNPQLYRR